MTERTGFTLAQPGNRRWVRCGLAFCGESRERVAQHGPGRDAEFAENLVQVSADGPMRPVELSADLLVQAGPLRRVPTIGKPPKPERYAHQPGAASSHP